jgi:parallel beta-helix repeat protein
MRWFGFRLPGELAISVAATLLSAPPASAATITVTGTGDTIAVDGAVTLREAITSIDNGANVNVDVVAGGAYGTNDQINFAIPGVGLQTIAPASNLPMITKPVKIDGYTQPGSSPNTLAVGDNAVIKIDLSGVNISNICVGLRVQGTSNTTIRGLAIHLCGAPLYIVGGSGHKVIGNFLGTDPTGSVVDWPSITYVLYVEDSSNDTIGGTAPADRNIISGGEGGAGVFINAISPNFSSGNIVQGNYIGTNAAGTAALLNSDGAHQYDGVEMGVNCTNNLIGGTAVGAGNLISGNGFSGVYIGAFSSASNVVQGNLIGTDATGLAPLGNGSALNGGAGVLVAGTNNLIGGTAPGAGNVIAFNVGPAAGAPQIGHGEGVAVIGTSGTTIRGNSIYSNTGLGIDLKDDGVTANVNCGIGTFGRPNFPILIRATLGAGTTILGNLNSKASTTYQIDFYSNGACDPTGFGEGQTYLGSTMVTTDASCNSSFIVTVPTTVSPQAHLTATATDPAGNTSEFSNCISLQAQFYTVTPCRLADTRNATGPYGGPALAAGASRAFIIGGQCGIPATAQAVAFNFTITQATALGDLRTFPSGGTLPFVSTMNWSPGQTRANNAVVPLGPSGDIGVHVDQPSGTVHLIIDVNGYFQ